MADPGIFNEQIEVYLAQLAVSGPQVPSVFEKMHAEASRRNFPIIGPEAGRFFYLLSTLKLPKRVLELGSGFGYSAIWWALGNPAAEIILTEYKEENLAQARQYATEAGVESRLSFHAGEAFQIARGLAPPFDIVSVDIDKQDYPAAIDFAAEVLTQGGLLIYDNMLWHGRITQPENEWTPQTRAVIETTRRLYDSTDWHVTMIPIRDGIIIAQKR